MGLSDDQGTLDQLVQMAAESAELEDARDAYATEAVVDAAQHFEDDVEVALSAMVRRYPPKGDATAEDLYEAEGPYLILMTLRGEGVGIWDGSWDEFYDDTKGPERFLKEKLGKWADDTGAGEFEQVLEDAAYETTGAEEEE